MAIACVSNSASLQYEIYEFGERSNPKLIASGKKEYSQADIIIEEKLARDEPFWSKSLTLEAGFSVGASIYRNRETKGFGMWGSLSDCDSFSWEWFDLKALGVFEKRQESGQISVKYQGQPMYQEITDIRFDTDISLRVDKKSGGEQVEYRIVVKKGSELKFSPEKNWGRRLGTHENWGQTTIFY